MPVDIKHTKNSNPLLDAVLSDDKPPVSKSNGVKKQISKSDNPLLDVVNAEKKNLGGGENATGSEKISPTVSTNQSEEKKDNSFYDQLMSFYKKGQEQKAKQDQSIFNVENRVKGNKVVAPNGVNIDVDENKLPSPLVEPIEQIQQRINEGTQTPDDVHILAQASNKTPESISAYLSGDTTLGLSIDNLEEQKRLRTDLTSSILKYNQVTGSDLVPEEVLSSSEKTSEFIQKINQSKSKFILSRKDNLAQRALNTEGAVANQDTPIYNLDMEQFVDKANAYKESLVNHATYSKILENEKAGVPKEQTLKDIARITNPKEYFKSIKATIPTTDLANPISQAGKIYDMVFGTSEDDELLNTQLGFAEFTYNNQQKQIANNQISEGYVTQNQDLVNQGKARMDATESDMSIYVKNPALLKQKIAQEVSKEMAFKAGQLEGSETQDYMLKFFGGDEDDVEKTEAFKKYLNDPATKDIAESMLDHPELFTDASYLGGMWDSFKQPFKELGLSVLDISGFRGNKDIYSEKIKDDLFPKEQEGTKADFTILSHPFKVRTALNTTANLTGMMVIAAATEGVAGSLGATANVSKSLGAYTSFGLPSYDAALKDSYNFLDTDAARSLYATITAITNAEGGRFLDLGKAVRIPGVSEPFAKMADKLSKNDLSTTAFKELSGQAEKAYVDFAVKYGKNVTKGAATMAYFGIANSINKIAFGDPNTKAEDILPQAAHAFMDGVLGMSIMGGFGAAREMKAEKNTTYKGFIYNMALNHDATKDVFQEGLKNGTYTQEQYNEKVQILNTAVAARNAMTKAQIETNVVLDPNQKSVYVANKTAESVLREKSKEKGITDAEKIKYEEQADRLRMQSTQTLDGLKFTPTLEPLYDLYHAEKEYDQALSEFNEKRGSVEDLEAAKNNYDNLINKYFTEKGLQDLAAEKLESKPIIPDEANKAIEEGIKSGQIKDVEANVLNTVENKIEFLKQVAQQAKGELADGSKAGEGGEQGKATRKTYGNEIVDAALKMFPAEVKEIKPVSENTKMGDIVGGIGTYKGMDGYFRQEGQRLIFFENNDKRSHDLGNIEEIKDKKASEFDVHHELSKVSIDKDDNIIVDGTSFSIKNEENPLSSIVSDTDGNIKSVYLKDSEGKKQIFKGQVAEDIAYQIHLKDINNSNETRESFERFINTDESAKKEINDAGLSETSTKSTTESDAEVSAGKGESVKDGDGKPIQSAEILDALDTAARSKKSMREKDKAMEVEAEKYGELGKRALEINRNFEKIVQYLKDNNKIEVKCP